MKTYFLATLFICCMATIVVGQQAKLEGYVQKIGNIPVRSVRVKAPPGQATTTDSKGHFVIAYPSNFPSGQPIQIDVELPEWVIYTPMLGEALTQNFRNHSPLIVILVRKRSTLALSPNRLSQIIAKWSDERAKQQSKDVQYSFLQKYAERYGFTLEKFEDAARQWANSKESRSKYQQALKNYFQKNYDRAAELAHESSLMTDKDLDRSVKLRAESSVEFIQTHKLEGNILFEQGKYRQAIVPYEEIDKRFSTRKISKEDYLEEWGLVKTLLGSTKAKLAEMVAGEESQQLFNEARELFQQSLTAFPRESNPEGWAACQSNLAVVMLQTSRKQQGKESIRLLKEAIEAFHAVLTIHTRERMPQDWAETMDNLGSALLDLSGYMPGEEKQRLVAESVKARREALEVRTVAASPRNWADTEENLALALIEQAPLSAPEEGDRLIAEAVAGLRQGLIIKRREGPSLGVGQTQTNLGLVLLEQGQRTGGEEGAKLITEAVEAHRQALKVYTPEDHPQKWAMIQDRLGNALSFLGGRLNAFNRSGTTLQVQAVEAYKAALTVRTKDTMPQDWAATQTNLGLALTWQGVQTSGDQAAPRLAEAAQAHRQALTVFTPETEPHNWAAAQHNLGWALTSHAALVDGEERARLLGEAVEAYRQALIIRTRKELPTEWAQTHSNLSETYALLNDWQNVANSLANVLIVYPKLAAAFQRAAFVNHELAFNYDEAFRLNQQWLENNKEILSAQELLAAQANAAETYFTTGRFDECQQRIAALLAEPALPRDPKIALRVIEIANTLALGKRGVIPTKMEALIMVITAQPADFELDWTFEGTKHFITQNKELTPFHAWLEQLFKALAIKDRDTRLRALREVQANFKEPLGNQ